MSAMQFSRATFLSSEGRCNLNLFLVFLGSLGIEVPLALPLDPRHWEWPLLFAHGDGCTVGTLRIGREMEWLVLVS